MNTGPEYKGPAGPEVWRIVRQIIGQDPETGLVTATSSVGNERFVLQRRRRFLFWKVWTDAAKTHDGRLAAAWATYFRIPFPSVR